MTASRDNRKSEWLSGFESAYPDAIELEMKKTFNFDAKLTKLQNDDKTDFRFEYESSEFEVGHLDWVLEVVSADLFQVCCKRKSDSKIWSVITSIGIVLTNKDDPEMFFKSDLLEHKFNLDNDRCTFDISKEDKLKLFPCNSDSNTSETLNIDIEIQFNIRRNNGFRRWSTISYDFSQPSDNTDFQLLLASAKSVYVNIGYLAQLSKYFSALRQQLNTLEKDPETGLPFEKLDVGYEEFVELLLVAYPSKLEFTETNISSVLALADRFLFEGVLADVETFLIDETDWLDKNGVDKLMRLQFSFMYQMDDLQDDVLESFTTIDEIRKIKQCPTYKDLSSEVIHILFAHMLELPEKKTDSDDS